MIGDKVEAKEELSPLGMVSLHGELWQAESLSGTIQPGEKIPWQAVYVLWREPLTPADKEWARRKLVELGLGEDA